MRRLSFAGLALLLVHALAGAQSPRAPELVAVGGVQVALPLPSGDVDAYAGGPDLRRFADQSTAPTNRMLALFMAPEDMAALRAARPLARDRMLAVQAYRKGEALIVGEQEFQGIKPQMRAPSDILAKALAAANEFKPDPGRPADILTKMGVPLQVGDVKSLGVFAETSRSISSLLLTKYVAQIDGKPVKFPKAIAMNVVLLRGKVMFLYVYSRFECGADLDWVKAQAIAWLAAAAAANP